jgi:hypothetical protein
VWVGAVRMLAAAGGGGGSRSRTIDCPRDQAVSGFSGRGDAYVDRLGLECRPLAGRTRFRIDDAPTLAPR